MNISALIKETAAGGIKRVSVLLAMVYACLLLARAWLESSMTMHMGVLIPALLIWGGCGSLSLLRARPWVTEWARYYRYSLLCFALFGMLLWMLPRLLDASLYEPLPSVLKWISLPLAGMALVLCWTHLPWLLRAVLQLEAIASLLRLGWLYMAAAQEYCVSYGIDDQQHLGYLLIVYAMAYGGVIGLRLMFGTRNNAD